MPSAQEALSSCDYLDTLPVFDAHDEYTDDGRVDKFDPARLEKICEINNARIEKRGSLSPIGPGHNVMPRYDADGNATHVPEEMQPPIWGWAANFHVKPLEDGTPAIHVDRYANRELVDADGRGTKIPAAAAMKRFPFRSVELHKRDGENRKIPGYIDRIALLRQTPRRDLGVAMYSATAGKSVPAKARIYYDAAKKFPINAVAGRRDVIFYAMSQETDMDPTLDASVDAPGTSDIESLISELRMRFPKLAELMTETPEEDPLAGDMPDDLPAGLPGEGGANSGGGEPLMFGKNSTRSERNMAAYLKKELAARDAKIATLEKARQAEVEQYSKSDAESRVDRLQRQYGKKLDYDREVAYFSKLPKEDRDAHEEYIVEHYAGTSQYHDLPPSMDIQTERPARKGAMTEADLEKYTAWMRQTGKKMDDAVAHFAKSGK